MFDKLEEVVARYDELNKMLVSPEVLADSKKMIECNKAINEITEIVEKYKEYKKYVDDIEFIKESFKNYFGIKKKEKRSRPVPGTILFVRSAAIAPAPVLKVRKAPAKIERTAYFPLLVSNKPSFLRQAASIFGINVDSTIIILL